MPITAKELAKICWFPFFVFMVNYILFGLNPMWYLQNNLDTPLHFFGGLSIAYASSGAFAVAKRHSLVTVNSRLLQALLIVATVMMAAVTWEFYEFLNDHFFGTHYQPSNFDTMKDLFMGTFGGLTFCLSLLKKKK